MKTEISSTALGYFKRAGRVGWRPGLYRTKDKYYHSEHGVITKDAAGEMMEAADFVAFEPALSEVEAMPEGLWFFVADRAWADDVFRYDIDGEVVKKSRIRDAGCLIGVEKVDAENDGRAFFRKRIYGMVERLLLDTGLRSRVLAKRLWQVIPTIDALAYTFISSGCAEDDAKAQEFKSLFMDCLATVNIDIEYSEFIALAKKRKKALGDVPVLSYDEDFVNIDEDAYFDECDDDDDDDERDIPYESPAFTLPKPLFGEDDESDAESDADLAPLSFDALSEGFYYYMALKDGGGDHVHPMFTRDKDPMRYWRETGYHVSFEGRRHFAYDEETGERFEIVWSVVADKSSAVLADFDDIDDVDERVLEDMKAVTRGMMGGSYQAVKDMPDRLLEGFCECVSRGFIHCYEGMISLSGRGLKFFAVIGRQY